MSNKYLRYIGSSDWSIKRQEVFESRGELCEKCGSIHKLQIHHGTYTRLGKEKLSDLFVLCDNCHYEFHNKYGTKGGLLRQTKAFIKGIEYKKNNKTLKQLDERSSERNIEIKKAIAIIISNPESKFSTSGIKSIKAWRSAKIALRKSIY